MSNHHIILLGPPGAGKGTQARRIVACQGYQLLSTGDILRRESSKETPEGRQLRETIQSGALVDDDTILGLIKKELSVFGLQSRFIFDGFPRNQAQAKDLDIVLKTLDQGILSVMELRIDPSLLRNRIEGRLMCNTCGESYHRTTHPPEKKGVCDNCDGELYERADDDATTLIKRLEIYENETAKLNIYYTKKNLLTVFDATQPIDQLADQIDTHILRHRKNTAPETVQPDTV